LTNRRFIVVLRAHHTQPWRERHIGPAAGVQDVISRGVMDRRYAVRSPSHTGVVRLLGRRELQNGGDQNCLKIGVHSMKAKLD
jgi:hypothetical protein